LLKSDVGNNLINKSLLLKSLAEFLLRAPIASDAERRKVIVEAINAGPEAHGSLRALLADATSLIEVLSSSFHSLFVLFVFPRLFLPWFLILMWFL
jgi:hypothetical protein